MSNVAGFPSMVYDETLDLMRLAGAFNVQGVGHVLYKGFVAAQDAA